MSRASNVPLLLYATAAGNLRSDPRIPPALLAPRFTMDRRGSRLGQLRGALVILTREIRNLTRKVSELEDRDRSRERALDIMERRYLGLAFGATWDEDGARELAAKEQLSKNCGWDVPQDELYLIARKRIERTLEFLATPMELSLGKRGLSGWREMAVSLVYSGFMESVVRLRRTSGPASAVTTAGSGTRQRCAAIIAATGPSDATGAINPAASGAGGTVPTAATVTTPTAAETTTSGDVAPAIPLPVPAPLALLPPSCLVLKTPLFFCGSGATVVAISSAGASSAAAEVSVEREICQGSIINSGSKGMHDHALPNFLPWEGIVFLLKPSRPGVNQVWRGGHFLFIPISTGGILPQCVRRNMVQTHLLYLERGSMRESKTTELTISAIRFTHKIWLKVPTFA